MSAYERSVMQESQPSTRVSPEREEKHARMVREFDPVADATTRATDTHSLNVHASTLRSPVMRQPAQTNSSLLRLQRTHGNRYVQRVLTLARKAEGEAEVAPEVESAIERARGGGQELDVSVQRKMESAFGADFGNVRVHTDAEADQLNHAVGALAFTTGSDIFFRTGFYEPTSSSGQELLAHELTHVVQQGGTRLQGKLALGAPDDAYEQEADRTAKSVVDTLGSSTSIVSRTPHPSDATVQRECACGGQAASGGECLECHRKRETLFQTSPFMRRQLDGGDDGVGSTAAVGDALSSTTAPMAARGFYYYFKDCMDTMGLPAPNSLFSTATAAIATIAAIQKAVAAYGTEVTIGELIGAGVLADFLVSAAALTASYYVGVCVGCAATAGVLAVTD